MTIGLTELARELAKASKFADCTPITIQDADFIMRTAIQFITNELVKPEGRVEIENFLVLQNKPYNQTGLHTRRIELRVSPNLKKRLRANMPK